MNKYNVGKLIKRGRENLGLTQDDLAEALGCKSAQYISNIERGLCNISVKGIVVLSKKLKIKPQLFVNRMATDFRNHLTRSIGARIRR